MNPAFLDDMSWEMAEVYGAITDQILINLAHYFPYFNANNLPASSFAYQAGMLAQMGKVTNQTARIIRNGLADADSALTGVLEAAIIQSIQAVEPDLYKAARLGILQAPMTPILAPNQTRAFQLYYQQAADKLNLVNTVMLESTQQAYQQAVSGIVAELAIPERMYGTQIALDTGAGETITGVSSWNQAMQHSIERLKGNGITGFIDHAGKRWSAEAYTAMDIRTTVFNTGRAAVWEINQDFGNDLYLVSYHNGARPLCYPWQSKVISATDHARTVVDLDGNEITVYAQSETSYGEPAGLFGINCKHYPTPFIPGVSTIHDHQQSPEANEKTYEESQKQRQLERTLREEKRDLAMLKAQGAPEEVIKAQKARCERADERIEDFCLETGRARHRDREAVYTKRAFPLKDSYDPALFETKQRDMINSFYQNGGTQQGYNFGEMNPKNPPPTQTPPPVVPVAPVASATPAAQASVFVPAKTIEEAEQYAQMHFGNKYSKMSYGGIDLEYANTFNRVLTEVNGKYDFSSLKGVQPMNLRAKAFRGTTAEAAYDWGVDGTLYINPKFYKTKRIFAKHKEEIDKLQETCIESGENFLKSGKYTGMRKTWLETLLRTKRQCVAQSYDFVEATFVHEAGHMLEDKVFYKAYDEFFGTKGIFEGKGKYLSESREKYGGGISAYAVTSTREYIAESFAAWWYGETSILDPKIVEVFEGTMRK